MTSVYFLIIVWVFFPFFAQWSCEDSNGRPVELEFGPLIFLSCACSLSELNQHLNKSKVFTFL